MPWCPKCGAEYRDGFTRCASCNVPLVDRLTDEQSKEANKSETERECDKMVLPEGMSSPIAVYTAKNRLEAESIEDMLRDNDIPVFDRPAAFRQIQSYSGADARFGVELVVDASQTSRARQLIEQTQCQRSSDNTGKNAFHRKYLYIIKISFYYTIVPIKNEPSPPDAAKRPRNGEGSFDQPFRESIAALVWATYSFWTSSISPRPAIWQSTDSNASEALNMLSQESSSEPAMSLLA